MSKSVALLFLCLGAAAAASPFAPGTYAVGTARSIASTSCASALCGNNFPAAILTIPRILFQQATVGTPADPSGKLPQTSGKSAARRRRTGGAAAS